MADQLPHTEAVLELFKKTNRPVGDGHAPKEVEERSDADYPYSVVYDNDTIWWRMSGPFNGPQDDKQFMYQVVYVGLTRRQAQMLAQRGRALVTRDNINVPDHRTRDFRFEQLGQTQRDDDIRPSLFFINDTYLLDVTPTQ